MVWMRPRTLHKHNIDKNEVDKLLEGGSIIVNATLGWKLAPFTYFSFVN